MSKPRVVYVTPDGDHATAAPIGSGIQDDGSRYIWIRTRSGEIRRAFETTVIRNE